MTHLCSYDIIVQNYRGLLTTNVKLKALMIIRKKPMKRLKYILMESEITLASFLMGLALVSWGLVAIFKAPQDFLTFSNYMAIGGVWFWLANYTLVGSGFMWVAYKDFPHTPSLLIGGYSVLVWTWVASVREFSNFTSGVVLNFIVILMGLLLVQRSSRPQYGK